MTEMKDRVLELGDTWRDERVRQVSHAGLRAGLARLSDEEPIVAEGLAEFWKQFMAGARARPLEVMRETLPFGLDEADWHDLTHLYVAADPARVVGMRVHPREVIFDHLESRFPVKETGAADDGGQPGLTPPAPHAA